MSRARRAYEGLLALVHTAEWLPRPLRRWALLRAWRSHYPRVRR